MEFSKRNWGWYLTFYSADRFKLKFLYFKSGHSCSMQRHKNRSETWCFLFGSGKFWKDGKSFVSSSDWLAPIIKGSSAVVPFNCWHQYTAIKPTLVLEIQTGDCREDDIERA